ncbi:MAG: hypothetical protein ACD_63C00135G0003 [uncultured bacterium]|nr:MAG: hypothetical protein ACD_63C00135G0003 [uncultured bacterium]
MSDYFKQSLKEDEEPIMLLRRHKATFIAPVARTVVLIIVPLAFLDFFLTYVWATAILLTWIVFVLCWGVYSWFTWYFNITVVTSQRIVDIEQKGFFNRVVREAIYDRISEVTFAVKGIFATMFNYGHVNVFIKDSKKPLVVDFVASPEIIKDKLLKIREITQKSSRNKDSLSAEELIEFIENIKGSGERKINVRVEDADNH